MHSLVAQPAFLCACKFSWVKGLPVTPLHKTNLSVNKKQYSVRIKPRESCFLRTNALTAVEVEPISSRFARNATTTQRRNIFFRRGHTPGNNDPDGRSEIPEIVMYPQQLCYIPYPELLYLHLSVDPRIEHRYTPYSSTQLDLPVTSSSNGLAATLGSPSPAPGAKQLLCVPCVSGNKSSSWCSRPISSCWLGRWFTISPHVRRRCKHQHCAGSQGRCSHCGRGAFGLGDGPDAGKERVD